MKSKETKAWSATMTVGQWEGYGGPRIPGFHLRDCIRHFQNKRTEEFSPVCAFKIVKSEILFKDYYEECWDITAIQYPRFPLPETELEDIMSKLAEFLLDQLNQNRITVCFPDKHVMFESEDAEESHE